MESLNILSQSLMSPESPKPAVFAEDTPRFGFEMAPAQACQPPDVFGWDSFDTSIEDSLEHNLNNLPHQHNFDTEHNYELAIDNTPYQLPTQSPSDTQDSSPVSYSRSSKCPVCHKRITRDMSRHLRTHEPVSRFKCVYPRDMCVHKTGQFNRPYDFKKHLLNCHFRFDNQNVRKLHNLNDKLPHAGKCHCGLHCSAQTWLDNHILPDGGNHFRCKYLNNVYDKAGLTPPSQQFSTRSS